jgi:hypothetical protein
MIRGDSAMCYICRVGQNRIYTPYMTVNLVISLPKIPYTHRIYIWFWPNLRIWLTHTVLPHKVGQNHTHVRIYSAYTAFSAAEIPINADIYGAHIRFWSTLLTATGTLSSLASQQARQTRRRGAPLSCPGLSFNPFIVFRCPSCFGGDPAALCVVVCVCVCVCVCVVVCKQLMIDVWSNSSMNKRAGLLGMLWYWH